MATCEGLSKLPIGGDDIVAGDGSSVAAGDLEGEGLAIEVGVALPVLSPVPGHGLPTGLGPFDGHRVNISRTGNVGDEHQVEVGVAIDGEPDPSLLRTGHPATEHTAQRQEKILQELCDHSVR